MRSVRYVDRLILSSVGLKGLTYGITVSVVELKLLYYVNSQQPKSIHNFYYHRLTICSYLLFPNQRSQGIPFPALANCLPVVLKTIIMSRASP
jgi:hypothetical protein